MKTPTLFKPLEFTDWVDWGPITTMILGQSHTSGKLLYKGPDGQSECGIWRCTPGKWRCHVTRDEFCHFLAGRCTYGNFFDGNVPLQFRIVHGLPRPAARTLVQRQKPCV